MIPQGGYLYIVMCTRKRKEKTYRRDYFSRWEHISFAEKRLLSWGQSAFFYIFLRWRQGIKFGRHFYIPSLAFRMNQKLFSISFRTDNAVSRINYLIGSNTFGISRNQKTIIIPYTTISCFTNSKIKTETDQCN